MYSLVCDLMHRYSMAMRAVRMQGCKETAVSIDLNLLLRCAAVPCPCCPAGGQKARVVFTAISLSNPHILLLDEPTNHLDMQSIDALCDALDEFQGGVVVISHDSQLLSRLCADEERSEVRGMSNCEWNNSYYAAAPCSQAVQ